MDNSSKNGLTAVVEYDYTAKETDELTLIKGAMITNIKTMSGGWWEGTLASSGKRGMFPDNFVSVVDADEKNSIILRDKTPSITRRCKVVFSYQENNNDELTLAVGDIIEFLGEVEEGWWRGKLKGKVGVFPSNFVEEIPTPSPISANRQSLTSNNPPIIITNTTNSLLRSNKSNSSLNSSREDLLSTGTNTVTSHEGYEAPSLPPKPVRETCKVLFAYDPANEDELSLAEGDIITILNKELPDKGWWKGELRGRIGVFPDNFVSLLPQEAASPLKDSSTKPERPPHGGKTSLMGNKQRKDSFGSKDSLSSDTNSSPITRNSSGPVFSAAAHRKSLDQKNNDVVSEKPPRKSLDLKNTEIRKSIESLEDKKATPPPVTKKPVVPIKKSPSITSVTNNLFSGLKSKVKGTSNDKTQDSADGVAGSKSQVADVTDRNIVGEKITLRMDKTEAFDTVERASMLVDPRAGRAKAPRRRPPSSTQSLSIDQPMNGSGGDHHSATEEELSGDVEAVKPKAREWEKHKAPWMDELKASQAKKTSPGHTIIVEPKSPSAISDHEPAPASSTTNETMSKSFSSSSFKSSAANHQHQTTTVELRSQSIEGVGRSSENLMAKSMSTAVSRISISDKTAPTPVENFLNEPSARTRSTSPSGKRLLAIPPDRVTDLEERLAKLEKVVVAQAAALEDLTKQLSDESTKVKVLKMQLEKYAQCVTQGSEVYSGKQHVLAKKS